MTKVETSIPIEDAPEDIRRAVQQLSFAYKRSADTLYEAEDEAMAEAVRRAEAVLFAAGQPLAASDIAEVATAGRRCARSFDDAEIHVCAARRQSGRGGRTLAVPDRR